MSIIIFVVVTTGSFYILEWMSDQCTIATDHLMTGLAVLIGLGSAIWYCLTKQQWKKAYQTLFGKTNPSEKNYLDETKVNKENNYKM